MRKSGDLADLLQWQSDAHGRVVAAISIRSPGAVGVRLGLLVHRIPRDAILRFYPQGAGAAYEITGQDVWETIERNLRSGDAGDDARTYWSPHARGEELTLEIELSGPAERYEIEIGIPRLSHFFDSPLGLAKAGPKQTGSCLLDVVCYPEWSAESNATAKMVFVEQGYSYLCSGTLLNDTASSGEPYFLSAHHCISSQTVASTLETYWFYRSQTCGGGGIDPSYSVLPGGATLLHTAASTDTSFMRLNAAPPPGVVFAAWSTAPPAIGTPVATVHHPSGELQKVSLGGIEDFFDCTSVGLFGLLTCAPVSQANSEFLSVVFSGGVTEGGSSGSGLFVSQGGRKMLVGQLYGGSSSCLSQDSWDAFGRFDLPYHAALHRWLNPPPDLALSVSKLGTGSGAVTSLPSGVDCGTTCTASFPADSQVTLAATGAAGSAFSHWSGACSGSGTICRLSMSDKRSVTAHFNSVGSPGAGVLGTPADRSTISGVAVISGYHCNTRNIEVFVDGVSLGKAGAGTRLLGTQGVCGRTDTGYSLLYNFNNLSNGLHVISITADGVPLGSHAVTTFQSGQQPWLSWMSKTAVVQDFPRAGVNSKLEWTQPYQNFLITGLQSAQTESSPTQTALLTLDKAGSGSGTVVSSPGGLSCGTTCSASFPHNSTVTLAASAATGSVFAGWSGACSGSSPVCQVSMNVERNVTANFAMAASAGVGVLGTPADQSVVSGVAVVSGYHCTSRDIEVFIDGVSLGKAGAGTTLVGTQGVCGRADTGYSLLYNFNNLSNGLHVVSVTADGIPLASHTVTTYQSGGQPWLSGVSRITTVQDFPQAGKTAILEWIQSYQNFLVVDILD